MHIRRMTFDDIPFAQTLKAQNNWNQREDDWRRQLELEPDACFVAEREGRPAGTACACVFGDIAWINLVLVDRAQRGQGIGTALLRHVVQHLDDRGVTTQRLDATPLGEPVYAKLGFHGEFNLARYEGVMPTDCPPVDGIEPIQPDDLPAVCAMDASVTGTERGKLLRYLVNAAAEWMRKAPTANGLAGYGLCRPGANAWQIGPIQGTPEAGRRLLLDAARHFAGQRVYLDVPIANIAAVHLADSLGLNVQRTFLRMARGRRVEEDLPRFWTAFGPEKG